ncbi:MAG: histidinol-phosphatase HisJ family protein [Andreesenia angusta]|nr:histidinol-phosphatase HisJ family protein [Andreesenia angusta]
MHDYHAHSYFSGDCNYSMEDMIKGALDNNCKSIAFTDHIDYDFGGEMGCELFTFEPEKYLREVDIMKKKFGDRIRILSGVEMGLQPHLVEDIEKRFPFDEFEFTILSLHTSDMKDLHDGSYFKGKKPLEAYEIYYNELLYCIENFKNYQIIGHINLIDRYARFLNDIPNFNEYSHILEKIFETIIKDGKGIEVNTSGFRYGMNSFLPNGKVLELYRDMGGKIITFGSDTHCPNDVLKYYEYTLKELDNMNFKEITHFDEIGNPIQIPIEKALAKLAK